MSKTCSNWQKFLLSLILRWPFLALLRFYQDWVQLYWTQCDFVTLCWVKYDVNDRKHYFTSFLGGPSWVLGRLSMVEYGWVWLSNLVWPLLKWLYFWLVNRPVGSWVYYIHWPQIITSSEICESYQCLVYKVVSSGSRTRVKEITSLNCLCICCTKRI